MFTLNCKGKLLVANEPLVMGIINITPDSFYEGSRFSGEDAILHQAEKMLAEGADILDIGGQSTRPGAEQVGIDEELDRVAKAIHAIHIRFPEAMISIDTYHSRVAREAVAAGASIINDITAGNADADMLNYSAGDGPSVDSGKQVSVLYTGKALPSGKVFESNVNTPGAKPIQFVVGKRSIIEGWDDGLRLFKKGGKGTLYIPAFLAYDAQQGPEGKPYANLMFDVEVVDVTDPPAQPNTKLIMPQPKNSPQANKGQTAPDKNKK